MRCPAVDPAATVSALGDEAMFLQIKSKHCGKYNDESPFTRVAVITGIYLSATGVAGWTYVLRIGEGGSRSSFKVRLVCRTAEMLVRSLNLDREVGGTVTAAKNHRMLFRSCRVRRRPEEVLS